MSARAPAMVVCAAIISMAARARAGNDDELFVGNQAAMSGGAVAAIVTDASATWYNPAGLGGVTRDQIDVSGTVYTLRLYSVHDFLSTTTGQGEDGSVTEFVSVPSQIAYVRRIAPGVSLGLGYYVPHASNFVLREGLTSGRATARSQFQIGLAVADTQHTAGAGLGIALAPNVRIGVSLIGGYSASTQSLLLFGSLTHNGETQALSSSTAIGTTSRISLESGLGLQVDLTPHFALGVFGRTPRVQLHASQDVIRNQNGAVLDATAPLNSVAQESVASEGIELLRAGRVGVSLAYRHAHGWVAAEFDVQPGLRDSAADVDRKLMWNARVGVYQLIVPHVALGAGLFSDRTPDRIQQSLLYGSGDFYGVSTGIELSNEHLLAQSEPVDSLVFTSVFALRYAFSAADFGRAVADPDQITTQPFSAARGTLRVHEIGLYVGAGLNF
jgi:hypothetical protein